MMAPAASGGCPRGGAGRQHSRVHSVVHCSTVHGQPAPVVGRVAMNMTMLDVTDIGAELDDEVVLIGRQGNAEIRVEDLAEKIGTISYEVVARINPLIPRVAVEM